LLSILREKFHDNRFIRLIERLLKAGYLEEWKYNQTYIRKLADLEPKGRKPRPEWMKKMSARRRKTLVVCRNCHHNIQYGRYDGQSLKRKDYWKAT